MNQDDKEHLERSAEERLNRQFGEGTVQKVEVLQHGDEPVIEPGQMLLRVTLSPMSEGPHETLDTFKTVHDEAIQNLRKRFAESMPFIGRMEFTVAGGPEAGKHPVLAMPFGLPDRTAVGRNLTPVMARLDPKDIETLDALITAGIVSNRAEGVRWALARIRERPAYTQLREHIGKIDELKAQL